MAGKCWSQNGEDLIIEQWIEKIPGITPVAVEFGAGNGYKRSNIRRLGEMHGWRLVQWDAKASGPVAAEIVTAENIQNLLEKYSVPAEFGVLSIDIDGMDYWVWDAIDSWPGGDHFPSIVCIEYNSNFPHGVSVTLPYNPFHRWDGSANFGASFTALCKLAEEKGYTLVAEVAGVNLIFVQSECVDSNTVVTVNLPRPAHKGLDPSKFMVV